MIDIVLLICCQVFKSLCLCLSLIYYKFKVLTFVEILYIYTSPFLEFYN